MSYANMFGGSAGVVPPPQAPHWDQYMHLQPQFPPAGYSMLPVASPMPQQQQQQYPWPQDLASQGHHQLQPQHQQPQQQLHPAQTMPVQSMYGRGGSHGGIPALPAQPMGGTAYMTSPMAARGTLMVGQGAVAPGQGTAHPQPADDYHQQSPLAQFLPGGYPAGQGLCAPACLPGQHQQPARQRPGRPSPRPRPQGQRRRVGPATPGPRQPPGHHGMWVGRPERDGPHIIPLPPDCQTLAAYSAQYYAQPQPQPQTTTTPGGVTAASRAERKRPRPESDGPCDAELARNTRPSPGSSSAAGAAVATDAPAFFPAPDAVPAAVPMLAPALGSTPAPAPAPAPVAGPLSPSTAFLLSPVPVAAATVVPPPTGSGVAPSEDAAVLAYAAMWAQVEPPSAGVLAPADYGGSDDRNPGDGDLAQLFELSIFTESSGLGYEELWMLQGQRQDQLPENHQAADAVAEAVVSGPRQQEAQMSAGLQQEPQMPVESQQLPPQHDAQEQEQHDDLPAADPPTEAEAAMAMAEVERMLGELPDDDDIHPFHSFGDEPWDFTWLTPSDCSDPVGKSATSRSEPATPPSPLPLLYGKSEREV